MTTENTGRMEYLLTTLSQRIDTCENAGTILEASARNFDYETAIRDEDMPYLGLSLALNGLIKKLIRDMRMKSDKELAEMNPMHKEEHSARSNLPYYVSRQEIISNPVPFDALATDSTNRLYNQTDKRRPGFSGSNHRSKALGHDPLLGLVFGTANIMTGTITRNDFRSWHIRTMGHERTARNGNSYIANIDTVCEPASLIMIFSSIIKRLMVEGKEGWLALGTALAKEVVHLSTDVCSLQSLPFPGMSVISEKLAHQLSIYGLNTGTLVEGPILMKVSNFIVAFLHRMRMEPGEDEELFRIRTQKILMYSNLIASSGDAAITFFEATSGDIKALRKFDLGGYLQSIGQYSDSTRSISKAKGDYMVDYYLNYKYSTK